MAIELASGFFNAIMQDGLPDRTYNCDDLNEFLKGLVSEMVFMRRFQALVK